MLRRACNKGSPRLTNGFFFFENLLYLRRHVANLGFHEDYDVYENYEVYEDV